MNNKNETNLSLSIWLLILPLLLSACTDHRVKTRFFVQGNCEECKSHIEKILNKERGVKDAMWDPQTSQSIIIFDTTRTSEAKLQQALAKGGFSTGYFEADTAALKSLPACCTQIIDRKLLPSGGIHGH